MKPYFFHYIAIGGINTTWLWPSTCMSTYSMLRREIGQRLQRKLAKLPKCMLLKDWLMQIAISIPERQNMTPHDFPVMLSLIHLSHMPMSKHNAFRWLTSLRLSLAARWQQCLAKPTQQPAPGRAARSIGSPLHAAAHAVAMPPSPMAP